MFMYMNDTLSASCCGASLHEQDGLLMTSTTHSCGQLEYYRCFRTWSALPVERSASMRKPGTGVVSSGVGVPMGRTGTGPMLEHGAHRVHMASDKRRRPQGCHGGHLGACTCQGVDGTPPSPK